MRSMTTQMCGGLAQEKWEAIQQVVARELCGAVAAPGASADDHSKKCEADAFFLKEQQLVTGLEYLSEMMQGQDRAAEHWTSK